MAQSSDDPAKLEHRDWMNIVYVRQSLEFLSAKGFECRAMLDVGANKAEWSDQFKTVYPGSSVFMIEPLEEMRPYLEKFSEGHPDAKFVIAGAGPAAGELEFTVWPSLSGSSFVPQAGDPLYDTYAKRTVPIVAIDDLIESNEMPVPDVAKLDVQGFELEVLQGAKRLFGTTEVFFMEVSLFNPLGPKMPTLVDVVNYMHDRGYVAFDIVGFYRRRKDHALGQCDMVFVKRDSALREYKGLTRKFDWDFMRYSE
jgi:FkbM family methyltransferase